jgi:protoporphyrinogen oxidase
VIKQFSFQLLKKNSNETRVIIGAGITGLTAAFYLKRKNIPVTVYEASGRVDVYAGAPYKLSLPQAFPRLAELESRYGSTHQRPDFRCAPLFHFL